MKNEKEFNYTYIWICSEIGQIKRKQNEYGRILKILEETKKQMEDTINKKRKEKRK